MCGISNVNAYYTAKILIRSHLSNVKTAISIAANLQPPFIRNKKA